MSEREDLYYNNLIELPTTVNSANARRVRFNLLMIGRKIQSVGDMSQLSIFLKLARLFLRNRRNISAQQSGLSNENINTLIDIIYQVITTNLNEATIINMSDNPTTNISLYNTILQGYRTNTFPTSTNKATHNGGGGRRKKTKRLRRQKQGGTKKRKIRRIPLRKW